ncbi:MAG: thioredoxin-related protein [Candidatus Paceibacteria bacterium]|jgi:thioredoxin-related protein
MSSYDMDRVRAFARGEMEPEQVARFEAELADNPELQAAAAAYGEVLSFTSVALEGSSQASASSLSLERLDSLLGAEPDARREPRFTWPWRSAAAASFLILSLSLSFYAWDSQSRQPSSVTMNSIPRLARAASLDHGVTEHPSLQIAAIASYMPVRDGSIQWLEQIDAGLRVAQATGRPLLLWCIHPTCPYCKRMRESTLLDPEVQELMASFVPVQLDVMQEERYSKMNPMEHGFPMFEVVDEELEGLHTFYNFHEPASFMAELQRGLDEHGPHEVLRWERLEEVAGVLAGARSAEERGEFGKALSGYQSLGELGAGLSLSAAGERGVARMTVLAHGFLDRAREASDCASILAQAADAFEASDYAADFLALEDEARRAQAFAEPRWTP